MSGIHTVKAPPTISLEEAAGSVPPSIGGGLQKQPLLHILCTSSEMKKIPCAQVWSTRSLTELQVLAQSLPISKSAIVHQLKQPVAPQVEATGGLNTADQELREQINKVLPYSTENDIQYPMINHIEKEYETKMYIYV